MSLFQSAWFHHITTKGFITAFGSLFNDLSIIKYNVDGTAASNVTVPIDYAPKNKWFVMIGERPDFTTNQVQITLPRMAFEITKFDPNMKRKIGFNGTFATGVNTNGSRTKIYNPTPIDLTVKLYALTKDNEDMLQIFEQIMPYFQPTLVMNFMLLPEYNISKDIPIKLVDYEQSDSYTGNADEQRLIESTWTFDVPMYYYGPIAGSGKIITDVKIGMSIDNATKTSGWASLETIEASVPSGSTKQSNPPITETVTP